MTLKERVERMGYRELNIIEGQVYVNGLLVFDPFLEVGYNDDVEIEE